MPLYADVKTNIVQDINRLNGSNVRPEQMTFSKPQATGGVWNGKDVTQNTAVRITANAGATWSGTNVFLYNRLDLSDFVTMIGTKIKGPQSVESTAALAKSFNTIFGFNFVEGDILDEPIVIDPSGITTIVLKAHPESLGWVGQWEFTLVKGDEVLDDIVSKPNLDGIPYPVSEDTVNRLAQAMFYGSDFSDSYDYFKAMEVGKVLDNELLGVLNAKSPYSGPSNPWTNVPAGPASVNNLAGSTVLYNGPAKDREYANSDRYQYVVALKPDTTKLLIVRGEFLIHYSKPLDPSEIG